MMRVLMLVNWMVPDHKDDLGYSFFKHWPDPDIEVEILGTSRIHWLHKLEKRLRFHVMQSLRIWRRMEGYDLVIAYGCQSALFLALCRTLMGRSYPPLVVLDVEGLPRFYRGLRKGSIALAARSIDGIVAFSSFYSHRYREISNALASRSTFIPYGLDFTNVPEPLNCPKEDYIVALGYQNERFRDWKTLLAAYHRVRHRVRLAVIGRCDLCGVDLGGQSVPSEVEFYPYARPVDLARLVGPARFAVVPLPNREMSLGQGTLLTLMGLRKAVVVADVAGIRDYVKEGITGRLYRCGDPDSLANIMQELLDDPVRVQRMELAGYQAARSEFCEPLMVQKLHRFVADLGVSRA